MQWVSVLVVASLICVVYGESPVQPHTSTELPVTTLLKRPHISSLHITSDIKFRYATTTVISQVKNPDTVAREAIFDVTLPNEAFITNLTLEIDGKIVVGEIKEKEVAKRQYDAAKARGESAGYIGTRHRETNRFNLAVTVAAQEKVVFHLTYQELLKRKHGHYEQVIYIDPGEPVPDMSVSVSIQEYRRITKLNVPRLRNDIDTGEGIDVSAITEISYASSNQAFVRIAPSMEYQQKQSDSGMAGQFVVQYDVERRHDAGDILLVNGYFVHFFAPSGFERLPNDVLFILDKSGSMSGTKLEQLKDAMKSILGQLEEGDRFNIISFAGHNSYWKDTMVNIADEDIMEEALQHIDSLKARGSTNIEGSLTQGLRFLAASTSAANDEEVRSSVIVFLTDGEATTGVTDTDTILNRVQTANEGNIPIFSLAFGVSADYEIVKKLAIQNNGFGRKIYEASDAAMQISGFYNEIAVTLMSNVTFHYLDAPVSNLTKHWYTNYFNGSEMVVAGRLSTAGLSEILPEVLKMKIFCGTVRGEITIVPTIDSIMDQLVVENMTKSGEFEEITEKVWAYLTIKQLLDRVTGSMDEKEKDDINQHALRMSLQYGFVTPLTSMVVTTDNGDDTDHFDPTPTPGIPRVPQYTSYPQLHTQRAYRQHSSYKRVSSPYAGYPGLPLFFQAPNSNPSLGYQNRVANSQPVSHDLSSMQNPADFGRRLIIPPPTRKLYGNSLRTTVKTPKRKTPKRKGYGLRSLVFLWSQEPLCFSLKGIPSGSYLAYEENGYKLLFVVSMRTRRNGKKKPILESVKVLHLSTNTVVLTLTGDTVSSEPRKSTGQPFSDDLNFTHTNSVNGNFSTFGIGALQFHVSQPGNKGVVLETFRGPSLTIRPNGIFGHFLSKNLVLIGTTAKKIATLNVGKKNIKIVYKPDPRNNCWSPKSNDILNMTDFL